LPRAPARSPSIAVTDGALGNALPEKYAPGRFVIADGTIVERR
jgi:hypothetical protein